MTSNSQGQHRIVVGVVFGGRSPEHDVSIRTAQSILSALDSDDFDCYPIYIEPTGQWRIGSSLTELLGSSEAGRPVLLPPDPTEGGLMAKPRQPSPGRSLVISASLPRLDVIVPAVHGTGGEDGALQGLFELADVAYVGAGVLGSAVGLDKVMTKHALAGVGFPIVDFVAFSRARWEAERDSVLEEVETQLGYPAFAKPATAGSSVGVTKAMSRQEMIQGITEAAACGRRLIVERAVDAREIEVAVIGNDDPVASVCGEIRYHSRFYDYESKYDTNRAELVIPAELSNDVSRHIRELAVEVFRALDCSGMARVDFFVERGTQAIWVNEINTIPGFTETSMFPRLWAASGIDYPDLLRKLIELAQERHRDRQRSLRSLPLRKKPGACGGGSAC